MNSDKRILKRKSEEVTLAPKRPPKKASLGALKNDDVFEKPIFSEEKQKTEPEESFFNLSDLSPTKENNKCPICNKALSHLNEIRKQLHLNSCLDLQETSSKRTAAAEKFENTIDCPLCGKPYPPGPHRTAHIKSCGKKNAISGSKLLEMVEIQGKVTALRKSKGLKHTSAPLPNVKAVTAPKLNGQPRNLDDEQLMLAKAISNSVRSATPPLSNGIDAFKEGTPEFTRVPDPNEKRRKRPKSFAVVEFAPRTCQCQVISTIQDRFVHTFKSAVRVTKEEETLPLRVDSQAKYQRRLVEKTARYESVADDFALLLNKGEGADIHITCGDGVIPVHRAILLARTRGFVPQGNTIRMEEPKEIVSSWLQFIYAGRVEWSPGQEDVIQLLAEKYGPDSLLTVRIKPHKEDNKKPEDSVPTISELIKDNLPGSSASSQSDFNEIASILDDTVKTTVALEDTICGVLDGTNPNDGEDPMQGINLSGTTEDPQTDRREILEQTLDDCIVLDDTASDEVITRNCNESLHIKESESTIENVITTRRILDPVPASPDIFDTESTVEDSSAAETEAEEKKEPWHMTPICTRTNIDNTVNLTLAEGNAIGEEHYDDDIMDQYPIDEPNYDYWDPGADYQPIISPLQPSTSEESRPKSPIFQELPSSADIITPTSSKNRKRSSPLKVSSLIEPAEADSFDKSLSLVPRSSSPKSSSARAKDVPPLAHSTPIQPPNRKLQFASNVKVIKTTGITPMPNYKDMDEEKLKAELARFGVRPLGRKRAVAKLIEIYEQTHPEIDPSTPTIRPLDRALPGVKEVVEPEECPRNNFRKPAQSTPVKRTAPPVVSSESSPGSDTDDGNKTLNSDRDEPAEESMLDDPSSLPKNIDEMTAVFLNWLRKKENEELYNHCLALQPVLLDELHRKASRADDPVCGIPKKALASILDSLSLTFSLPVTTRGGPRIPGGGRGAARRGPRK